MSWLLHALPRMLIARSLAHPQHYLPLALSVILEKLTVDACAELVTFSIFRSRVVLPHRQTLV